MFSEIQTISWLMKLFLINEALQKVSVGACYVKRKKLLIQILNFLKSIFIQVLSLAWSIYIHRLEIVAFPFCRGLTCLLCDYTTQSSGSQNERRYRKGDLQCNTMQYILTKCHRRQHINIFKCRLCEKASLL